MIVQTRDGYVIRIDPCSALAPPSAAQGNCTVARRGRIVALWMYIRTAMRNVFRADHP